VYLRLNSCNTGCPTTYQTRQFFNITSILSGRKWWPLPAHVTVPSHFLHNEVSPFQISLQYPH